MTDTAIRVLTRLRALFEVIAEEAHSNPAFARKLEAALGGAPEMSSMGGASKLTRPATKEAGAGHAMLHNITFDPLECHIEAALLNGREHEARAFLGKLDRAQLEAVIRAQRLPGAKNLQKTIHEDDPAAAVDAIVGSAAERLRSRHSAAR